jgi:hypothetical protein
LIIFLALYLKWWCRLREFRSPSVFEAIRIKRLFDVMAVAATALSAAGAAGGKKKAKKSRKPLHIAPPKMVRASRSVHINTSNL